MGTGLPQRTRIPQKPILRNSASVKSISLNPLRNFGPKSFFLRLAGVGLGAIVLLFLIQSPVSAQEAVSKTIAESAQTLADNLWVVVAALLVFLMQLGFGFLEAGLTRAKNVANIMAKNLADMAIGTVAFFVVGYAIAFGKDAGGVIGSEQFFLSGANGGDQAVDTLSTYVFFFFQVVFAATAVTIASGAMAERTKFSGYVIFSAVMTAFIYPMVVHASHWGGEDGIIASLKIGDAIFTDFAGSSIVHSTGGWAAMMGALILGPRLGRYQNNSALPIPGHNIAFTAAGIFILWFGWFGFNGGSQLAFDEAVSQVLLTTLISAAAGGIAAAATITLKTGSVDVAMTGNGVLAGLVGITAGTHIVNPFGALIIGAVAGVIVVYSIFFFDRVHIDDPVGAISVHGICGVWGTLAVGLFASVGIGDGARGLFYGGGISLLVVQLIGILIIFGWVTITTGAVFIALSKLNLLRVSREDELLGLDVTEHGSLGYGAEFGVEHVEGTEQGILSILQATIGRVFKKKSKTS